MTHSPTARSTLLTDILSTLYNIPTERIGMRMANAIRRNSALHGNRQMTLQFNGRLYSTNGAFKGSNAIPAINAVHPDMRDKVREILAEQDEIDREKAVVIGYIQKVLMASDDLTDYEILFPEALHPTLHEHREFFAESTKSMPPQFLGAFAESSVRYIQAIKLRLMTNFIEPKYVEDTA